MTKDRLKIIYTKTDEAPMLATYSLLPIINAFVKRFPEPVKDASGNPTNEYDFFRPEILDIRPIKIYRDKEEELKRKAQLARVAAKKEAEEEQKRVAKAMKEKEDERLKIIEETRREFEKAQKKQNKEVKKMFELAQKQTKAEIVKNKFSVTNIEETMSDLLGSLSQAQHVADDWEDSDDTPVDTPQASPKHTTTEEEKSTEEDTPVIENIEIVITDISGNDENDEKED